MTGTSNTVDLNTIGINRVIDHPLIAPGLDASIGDNIQGPSMIKVPDWVDDPLGKYYLYFADHKGSYIRLAYADNPLGPFTVHVPGSLQLEESHFLTQAPETTEALLASVRQRTKDIPYPHDIILDLVTPHIASPDVHVDHVNKKIIMYFHGLDAFAVQLTRAAVSDDGVHFRANEALLGQSYMRVFDYAGYKYAMSMPGQFYRSKDGLSDFDTGPMLFESNMRHAGLVVINNTLLVFWTRVTDTPERILVSRIDLSKDWLEWKDSQPIEVMRPETIWEGADQPIEPSMRSVAYTPANQLRDPAIFVDDDDTYLLYAIAGEAGIGIVKLTIPR
ncbi:MAG: hypothetical protein QMC01_02200 [Pseudomonadales bacterium]